MLIDEHRARQAQRRAQRDAQAGRAGRGAEIGSQSVIPFALDGSALDGAHGLDGGGAFMLDVSKLDGLDGLRGGDRPPTPDFQLDVTRLDGGGALSA